MQLINHPADGEKSVRIGSTVTVREEDGDALILGDVREAGLDLGRDRLARVLPATGYDHLGALQRIFQVKT